MARPRRGVDVVARQALRTAVLDDVDRLVGGEPPVHGHLSDAELLQRSLDDEPLEPEAEPHAEPIARSETETGKCIGDAVGSVVPLAVGEHVLPVDHRDCVGLLRRPELGGAWFGFVGHGAR